MGGTLRLALNPDTTPLSVSDTLVFKPFEERAREAQEADFAAVNADRGEEGLSPEKVLAIAGRYGLEIASGFFHGHFHDAGQEESILSRAREQAEFSKEVGQTCLFASSFVSPPERHALAGRIGPQEPVSLSDDQFRQMARTLERTAELWSSHGIRLCYHPHVATYVEAPHEIDRLMEMTDPELVRLGPDTGHTLLGGGDPVGLIRAYFDRLEALHIKDVVSEVVEEVRRRKLDYRQACARGVWTEIGSGDVDFPALFSLLREKNWSGWVIVETDHTRLATALESSRASRRYLKEVIGI